MQRFLPSVVVQGALALKKNTFQVLTFFVPVFILLPISVFSQGVMINAGAICKTTGSAYIILNDANFTNNGTFTAATGGTVSMNGTSTQTIGGLSPATFENLSLDNPNGLSMANSETVSGILSFTNGKIMLGDNDLNLGSAATISGYGSNSYVITDGAGSLRQYVLNNATDVTYPIGLAGGYFPLSIQLMAGSTADGIGARVINGLYTAYDESGVPAGSLITGHAVQSTWFLDEDVPGGSDATVTLQWDVDGETPGFDRSISGAGLYTGSAWQYTAASASSGSGPYAHNISGITSFSPLGVFSRNISCSVIGPVFCVTDGVQVDYTLSGDIWNSGNIFTAQLSDASGSFDSPADIGTATSQVPGTISAVLPGSSTDGAAYRIRVGSSNPSFTGVDNGTDLEIHQLRNINGNITYYNLANTPLTSDVMVKLYQDDSQVGSDFTVTDGTFAFNDLCPGDYELRLSSTKSTAGSVNTTDAAQVNYWGAHPYNIEKVRFYAGDVTGGTFFINSSDAQLIKAHFVYGTPFSKGEPWSFWKTGETISSNSTPTESYPSISLPVGENASADIYGLCSGDFNRSFSAEVKSAAENLDLVYAGTIPAGENQEFDLPVKLVNKSGIGAVSLILNFPADLVEIKDVEMNYAGSGLEWLANGNELRIGWDSQNPVYLNEGETLLNLKLKTTAAFTTGTRARFSLAENPLNELADDLYEVINNAVISVAVIEATTLSIDENQPADMLSMSISPIPMDDIGVFSYTLPSDGRVTLKINSISGNQVSVLLNEVQAGGYHTLNFDAADLGPGIYIAALRFVSKGDVFVKTLKIIKH